MPKFFYVLIKGKIGQLIEKNKFDLDLEIKKK